jgi:hypothetical protein
MGSHRYPSERDDIDVNWRTLKRHADKTCRRTVRLRAMIKGMIGHCNREQQLDHPSDVPPIAA